MGKVSLNISYFLRAGIISFLAFFSLFTLNTSIVNAEYNLGPNVEYVITETSGYNPSLTIEEQGDMLIHYVVSITNHGPGPVDVEKAAFASPNAGWAAVGTDEFLDQSLFEMTGKTHYEEGESGTVEFFYDTTQKNCGSVQIDAGFRDPNDGNFVFIGTMINYGVDCPEIPACNETALVTLSGPATTTPGASLLFNAHIENNGNTRWYHGSYFQFVQTTNFSITPTYGHYTPEMLPGDTRDFSFTLNSPTVAGIYTVKMQNVHRAGAEYQLADGTVCAPVVSSDVYFGEESEYVFEVIGNATNTPPTLTLVGQSSITINLGQTYVDLGATAQDLEDGNITANIVVTGSVNTSVVGVYTLIYNVSDSQGLAATPVSRTVNVVNVPPVNTPPVITLVGANPAVFYVGDPYVELGATAIDAQDGNITANIVINSSNVNTAIAGTYTVTYNVTDSGGLHAVQVSRTINVLNPALTGSIRVCLVLADNNNVVATTSAGLPAGVFSINLLNSTSTSSTVLHSKTWTTASFDPNASFVLQGQDDADCITYNNIPYGTYYYSQLSVTGPSWLTAKYNDNQSIHPINNVFDFANYSLELFNNNSADDAGRNLISDGQIVIDASNQNKTLVIYEMDDPGLSCLAPQITSPLTASITVGQPFTYSLTATSSTPVAFTVTNLPAGLTFSATTNTITGIPTTAGTFNINLLAVNNCVGGLDAETLVLTVNPIVVGANANLSISKVSNHSRVNVNEIITYTITLVNNGPSTANNVVVTDVLPTQVTFVSATSTTGTYASSTGLWLVGSLNNGATRTLTINVKVNDGAQGQEVSNTVTVTANESDPDGSNNSSIAKFVVNGNGSCSGSGCGGVSSGGGSVGSNSANLGVTKTVNKTVALPGDTVIYTINVVNYGANSTTGVVANDLLPNTLNFVSATTTTGTYNNLTGVWNIGNLSNGASAILNITATVKNGIIPQAIVNTVNVTGSVNDQDNSNNTASVAFNTGTTVLSPITPPTPPTSTTCSYLLDYLRADFNNNPVEVIKLQVFLKEFEGFSGLQVTGVYDAQTILALNAFQSRYASDILTPWGHNAPTGYTYILTKKKVNEIYCQRAFPVTVQEQQEINSFRNLLLSLQNAGITNPGASVVGTSTPIIDINSTVGLETSTTSALALATTTDTGVMQTMANNLAFAFGAVGGWIGGLFDSICEFLNWLFLLVIGVILYLWYREKKHYREIDKINKEIDLQ